MHVRRAEPSDADWIGVLLHDFNTEYHDVTPGAAKLAERIAGLLGDQTVVLLAVDTPATSAESSDSTGASGVGRPDGLAVLRFQPSLWSEALECYLAELYVVPTRRGSGIGRALIDAVVATATEQGADYIFLGTSEDDVAARGLYESAGFTNTENGPDSPVMYVYERQLSE